MGRLGENLRPDVPTLEHPSPAPAEALLLGDEAPAHAGDRRDRGRVQGDLGLADRVGDVPAVPSDAEPAARTARDRSCRDSAMRTTASGSWIGRRSARLARREPHGAVHRAGVDVGHAEPRRERARRPWTCPAPDGPSIATMSGAVTESPAPTLPIRPPARGCARGPSPRRRERPPGARREPAVPNGPDRRALQLRDEVPGGLEHPPNLAGAALEEGDPQPGVALPAAAGRRDPLDAARPEARPVEEDSPPQALEVRLRRDAGDLDRVFLAAARARMRDAGARDRRRR